MRHKKIRINSISMDILYYNIGTFVTSKVMEDYVKGITGFHTPAKKQDWAIRTQEGLKTECLKDSAKMLSFKLIDTEENKKLVEADRAKRAKAAEDIKKAEEAIDTATQAKTSEKAAKKEKNTKEDKILDNLLSAEPSSEPEQNVGEELKNLMQDDNSQTIVEETQKTEDKPIVRQVIEEITSDDIPDFLNRKKQSQEKTTEEISELQS